MNIENMHIDYSLDGLHYWNISKAPFGEYELYCGGHYQASFSNIDDAIKYINEVEE